MNRYFVEPLDQLANTILQSLFQELDVDIKFSQIGVDGNNHNVYEVHETLYYRTKSALESNTDNPKVMFWIIPENGEVMKHLLRAKRDPLVHVRKAR